MRPEKNATLSGESNPAIAGWLNACLVDGDEAAIRSARRLRRRSLIVSLAVQFGIVATVALVPLFAHVAAPQSVRWLPPQQYPGISQAIPPRGGQAQRPAASQPTKSNLRFPQILQPPRIPDRVVVGDSSSAQAPQLSWDSGIGESLDPMGPGVRGGTGAPETYVHPPIVEPPATRTKAQPPKVHRVSEGVQQAMLIHRVEPVYPALARQSHIEGTVRLHAIVGRDGVVRDLEVLSGPALFVRESLEAVRQWRYRPTILNGEPVEVDTYITVIFQLSH